MSKKVTMNRDVFALSLGGVTAVTSFANVPIIAHDRLRKRQIGAAAERRQWNWRLCMPNRFRVV